MSDSLFVVFEAHWRNQRVAVKRLLLPDGERERAAALAAFARECDTMRHLPPHKNVLGLLAIVSEPPALVTEFCAGTKDEKVVVARF